MSKDFEGKVVIVTGGGGGLGGAVALKVAERGAKVALVDLRLPALEETKKKIEAAVPGAEVHIIDADVTKEEQVEGYVNETVKKFGRIDGFHNNAGFEGQISPMAEYDDEAFKKVFEVNMHGVFYGLKYVLRVMQKQGSGYIVNTASCAGIQGVMFMTPYVATKHAVVGLTRSAAVEYGQYGISVNAIAPGAIQTPMMEQTHKKRVGPGGDWEESLRRVTLPNPKKRMGKPEEIGELVAFLLSGKAEYINGAIISIDGGQSAMY